MPDIFIVGGLLASIIAVVAGIVILIWPRIISYIIAIYLLIVGVMGLVVYFT